MKLAPNWKELLRKAWSVRLILASFAADCLGIVLTVMGAVGVHESPWQSITMQVIGAALNLAALGARLVYQRGLSKGAECG